MTKGKEPQRFSLSVNGHAYQVETSGHLPVKVRVRIDGEEALGKDVWSDRETFPITKGGARRLEVRSTMLGRVRRVTLKMAHLELDLDPEPDSPAARRLDKERERPVLYAVLDVLVAAAGVLLPLLGIGAIVTRLLKPLVERLLALLPDIDLPRLPLPSIDLPDIPWPSIDLSWIPDWTPPAWLAWILENLDRFWPIIFAVVLAVHEVRRRRRQDELKARMADGEEPVRSPDEPAPAPTGGADVGLGTEGRSTTPPPVGPKRGLASRE